MLEGHVTPSGEPVVPLQLVLHKRPTQHLAVVDTGFNGYLCVPKSLLINSTWRAIGTEEFEMATGAIAEQAIYLGEVVFDGRAAPVYVVATHARDILIGTKLLRNKMLTVNFKTRHVTIR